MNQITNNEKPFAGGYLERQLAPPRPDETLVRAGVSSGNPVHHNTVKTLVRAAVSSGNRVNHNTMKTLVRAALRGRPVLLSHVFFSRWSGAPALQDLDRTTYAKRDH
jgi:hypothetical protein